MCQFFSLVSDGKGNVFYFDAMHRKQIRDGKLNFEPDSHTSIATHFGFEGAKEDKLNKYEYNPLTKIFTVDQINTDDDQHTVEAFCKKLDFKTIIPELNLGPIVNALQIKRKTKKPSKQEIKLLKDWDSVRASAWGSVWDSVRASVGDSVRDSVGASVWDSVRDNVRASVWDSVGGSVWDSVWAYTSSFFVLPEWKYCEKVKYKKGTNPFQPCIDLWNAGLVPSFDGKTWRLHAGEKAEIVYSWTPKKAGNK